jgi:tetratricopeptide (TPR) repeat protein
MRVKEAIAALLGILLSSTPCFSWTHMARTGESLEQLAVRYYGTADKTMLIRAANGFVHPDDGRLAEGERVEIPEVTYYRVKAGDTWSSLANRFLSSSQRAPTLASLNGYDVEEIPAEGKIIQIPYHVRHIFAKGESLKSLIRIYYGGKRSVDWLRQYNNPDKRRYGRGEVIIVPLIDLTFTEEERARIEAIRADQYSERDLAAQNFAREAIAGLKAAYEKGRYVEIVTTASRLLGYGRLTAPQEIGIHNFLASAYVALGERALAVETFKRAIELQPEMDLSAITNSPKILDAFNEARRALDKKKKSLGKQSKPKTGAQAKKVKK